MLAVLSCFASVLPAQVVQVGRIIELNSNGKPILGASAVCLSDSDVQPATTDNDGIFLLSFKKHSPGDIVCNLRVTKPDFEIVNAQVLKSGIILTEKDTLKIVMTRPEQLAEARAHYYDVIDTYHLNRHEAIIARLKKELEAAKITAAAYEQRATEAERQLKIALGKAEHYADLFSRINKDDLDATSRFAFQALSEGDIGRAIKIYEDVDAFGKMKEKIAKRDDAIQAIKDLEPQVINEADLRMVIGGDENIRRASEIFRTIAYCDSTNIVNCVEYLQFLINMGQFNEAYEFADEAFHRKHADPIYRGEYANECNSLAVLYNRKLKYQEALAYAKEAVAEGKKVCQYDSGHLSCLSAYVSTVATVYWSMGQADSTDYYFRQCFDVWENKMPYIMNFYKESYIYDLTHYAKFNVEMNRLENAQKLLEKALTVCRDGYEFSHEEFRPILVEVFDELVKLSKATGNEAEERHYREEAESYRK